MNNTSHPVRLIFIHLVYGAVMIHIGSAKHDTMKEACERVGISRQTMLSCIRDGFFSEPPTKRQGRGKQVRYFTEEWYLANESKLNPEKEKIKQGV